MAAAFFNQYLHLTSIHPCFTSTSSSSRRYRGLSSSSLLHPVRPCRLESIRTATDPNNHDTYEENVSINWNWVSSSFRFMEEQLIGRFVDQKSSPPRNTTVDMNRLVDFLYEDIPHVFDDQGIDHTMYDENLRFRDPITKYDSIYGYLAYIFMLKNLFKPEIQLHYIKQTGPYLGMMKLMTAMMKLMTVPWKPRLVVTGTSIMHINPENHKFCSHVSKMNIFQ